MRTRRVKKIDENNFGTFQPYPGTVIIQMRQICLTPSVDTLLTRANNLPTHPIIGKKRYTTFCDVFNSDLMATPIFSIVYGFLTYFPAPNL